MVAVPGFAVLLAEAALEDLPTDSVAEEGEPLVQVFGIEGELLEIVAEAEHAVDEPRPPLAIPLGSELRGDLGLHRVAPDRREAVLGEPVAPRLHPPGEVPHRDYLG